MERELRLSSMELPDMMQLLFHELGTMIDNNADVSEQFEQSFEPNVNQTQMLDILESSPVPDDMFIHLLCYGGVRSGKTYGILWYCIKNMLKFPGVRVLAVRTHLKEVKNSIFADAISILDQHNIHYTSNMTDLKIFLDNGSEFWMCSDKSLVPHASDKADSLGGTQFSIIVCEECDSISEELVNTIPGRMSQNVGNFRKAILYACNPPSKNSWVYRWFFEDNEPDDPQSRYRALFMPMEGNVKHLGQGYIQSVSEDYARNPQFYKRMRQGAFGANIRGIPYFAKNFQDTIHVSEKPLTWNRGCKLSRGWDFGYRGTALVVAQDDLKTRQIKVFRSIVAQNVLLESFCDEYLPELERQFPGAEWEDFVDPAGRQKVTQSKYTCLDIMRSKGLRPKYKITSIAYGLNIINEQLRLFLNSRPVLIIDPMCEVLIEAFSGGYCNQKDVTDDEPRPVKDGYFDHCNTTLTTVMTDRGWVTFGELSTTDRVWTRKGWKRILKIHDMGVRDCITLSAEHGELTCTPEHRIMANGDWVEAKLLRSSDEVCILNPCKNISYKKPLSMVCGPTDTLTTQSKLGAILGLVAEKLRSSMGPSISMSGSRGTGRFQQAITYITEMGIWLTTLSTISYAFLRRSIASSMLMTSAGPYSIGLETKLLRGTAPQKVKPTMSGKAVGLLQLGQRFLEFLKTASSAAKSSRLGRLSQENTVHQSVGVKLKGLNINPAGAHRVYDLTVEDCHEYFTEFGLCHNCMDAFRYLMIHLRKVGQSRNADAYGNKADWEQLDENGNIGPVVMKHRTGSLDPGPRRFSQGGMSSFKSRMG